MSLDVYLDTEPCDKCGSPGAEIYWRNITHNLGSMANAAGIYEHLWHPETIGITKASQLIEPLTAGLDKLISERVEMQKYNPINGWGDYMALVSFVSSYLAACKASPDATVRARR